MAQKITGIVTQIAYLSESWRARIQLDSGQSVQAGISKEIVSQLDRLDELLGRRVYVEEGRAFLMKDTEEKS